MFKAIQTSICKIIQMVGFISFFIEGLNALDATQKLPEDLYPQIVTYTLSQHNLQHPSDLKRVCKSFNNLIETDTFQELLKKEYAQYTRHMNDRDCAIGASHVIQELKKCSHIIALTIKLPQQYLASFSPNISHSNLIPHILRKGMLHTPNLRSLTIDGNVHAETLLTEDEDLLLGFFDPLQINPDLPPKEAFQKPQLQYLTKLRELTLTAPLGGDKKLVRYFENQLLPALPNLTFSIRKPRLPVLEANNKL